MTRPERWAVNSIANFVPLDQGKIQALIASQSFVSNTNATDIFTRSFKFAFRLRHASSVRLTHRVIYGFRYKQKRRSQDLGLIINATNRKYILGPFRGLPGGPVLPLNDTRIWRQNWVVFGQRNGCHKPNEVSYAELRILLRIFFEVSTLVI